MGFVRSGFIRDAVVFHEVLVKLRISNVERVKEVKSGRRMKS